MDPKEVIRQVQKLETKALSPDPILPPRAPFPWLSHITPSRQYTIPMISGCITPSILQEALRRTPNHKAAGPDWVPGLILKHMPLHSINLYSSSSRPCPSRETRPRLGCPATPSPYTKRVTMPPKKIPSNHLGQRALQTMDRILSHVGLRLCGNLENP